jgi:hypothetical protein
MSTTFYGLRPSPDHQREIEARQRGERLPQGPGAAANAKRSLDDASREYQDFKLRLAAEQRAAAAPERATQAREAISGARTPRDLDRAFETARRSLRR